MYVYKSFPTASNNGHSREKSYKNSRKNKSKLNIISGTGVATLKRNQKKKKKKRSPRARLLRKNIDFLKSLGLKVKK